MVGGDGHEVTRTYRLHVPPGYQRYLAEAAASGDEGLPLIVALHGGGSSGLVFSRQWRFSERVWPLAADPVTGRRDWRNQCIVLFLDGYSPTDKLLPADAQVAAAPVVPGSVQGPAPAAWLAGETSAALGATTTSINASLAAAGRSLSGDLSSFAGVAPQMQATFNPGRFAKSGSDKQDDVAFVTQLIEELDLALGQTNPVAGATRVFDPKRRYLVAYSAGGLLGYRLISEMPADTWAAYFAMRTSIGGQAFEAPPPGPDLNAPPRDSEVSLFHLHGGRDVTVPGTGPRGHLNIAVKGKQGLVEAGFSEAEATFMATRYFSMATAGEAYRVRNGLPGPVVSPSAFPTVAGPSVTDAVVRTSNYLTTPTTMAELLGDPTAPRRTVVVTYLDPSMNHNDWTPPGSNRSHRYLRPEDVWQWLMAHPRP